MAKSILIEEFHLGVRAPRGLARSDYDSIDRTVNQPRFQARLRQALRAVFRRHPALRRVRVTLTR